MTASTPLTPQQWAIAHKAMDMVDALKAPTGQWTEEDTSRVRQLVATTYESQGVAVDMGLIDQAISVALQAPMALPPKDSPLRKRLEKTQALIEAVERHTPFTDRELAEQMIEWDAKHPARPDMLNSTLVLASVGAAVVFSVALASMFSWQAALIAIVPFGLSATGFTFSGMAIWKSRRDARKRTLEQALAALTSGDYGFESEGDLEFFLLKSHPHLGNDISPLDEELEHWNWASDAAREDGRLFRAWARWLDSNKPIRVCEVELLREAAKAIREQAAFFQNNADTIEAQKLHRQRMLSQLR